MNQQNQSKKKGYVPRIDLVVTLGLFRISRQTEKYQQGKA